MDLSYSPSRDINLHRALRSMQETKKSLAGKELLLEADEEVARMNKLKTDHKKNKMIELHQDQRADKEYLDSTFQEEMKSLNKYHKCLLEEFRVKSKDKEEKLIKKIETNLKSYSEEVEKNTPARYKPSSSLLNLIQCKENALKSEKFKTAHRMIREIEELKQEEMNQYMKSRQKKIQKLIDTHQKKLSLKVYNFRDKQKQTYSEISKQIKIEVQELEKKFNNLKHELAIVQKIEANKTAGKHVTGAGISFPDEVTYIK